MVDYIVWGMADPLTVEQAACLWAGIDPSSSMLLRPQAERAAIAPFVQTLTGAIVSGELQADSKTNPSRIMGDYNNSFVKRADLMALAESRGQRPAFLFDTMLKPGATGSKSEPAPNKKNKGGRPTEWDWDTFTLEIIRIANTPDGLPDTKAKLAEMMCDWFVYRFDDHPQKTTLNDRIRPIYQYLEQYRKPTVR